MGISVSFLWKNNTASLDVYLNIKFLFDKIFCGDDDDLLSLKKFAIDDKNKQYLSKVVNYFKKWLKFMNTMTPKGS